MKVII